MKILILLILFAGCTNLNHEHSNIAHENQSQYIKINALNKRLKELENVLIENEKAIIIIKSDIEWLCDDHLKSKSKIEKIHIIDIDALTYSTAKNFKLMSKEIKASKERIAIVEEKIKPQRLIELKED